MCKEKRHITQKFYDIYRVAWIQEHISPSELLSVVKECVEETHKSDMQTLVEYIEEYGIHGELYVCFDEFLANEFLDDDFMEMLASGDTSLMEERQSYIEENKE